MTRTFRRFPIGQSVRASGVTLGVTIALIGGIAAEARQQNPPGQTQQGQGQTQQGGRQGGGQGQTQGQGEGRQGGGRGGANQPQRDPNGPNAQPTVGTGAILGRVVTADAGRPVRGVQVLISATELRPAKNAVTDDLGQFSFTNLPAGRYTITASKRGYCDAIYGQKEPRRPGTPIQLADAQKLEKVDVRIAKGGVLTGMLLDEHGDPLPGTQVRALRAEMRTGEKQLVSAGSDETDDRGIYRIYGLPPGDYLVNATALVNLADLRQMVQDATQAIGGGGAGRGGGGLGALVGALGGAQGGGGRGGAGGGRGGGQQVQQILNQVLNPGSGDSQPEGYAPVYYPGTTASAMATTVTLAPSEERSGLDFQMQLVPTAKIEGVVSGQDGDQQGVMVTLVNEHEQATGLGTTTARVSPDGKFTFTNIAPGQYTLMARGQRRIVNAAATTSTTTPAASTAAAQTTGGGRNANGGNNAGGGFGGRGGRGGGAPMETLWGQVEVTVDGHDQSGISITLAQGMSVSGRITLEGAPAAGQQPVDITRVRVTLAQQGSTGRGGGGAGGLGGGPTASQVDANGRFTITGVAPGNYAIRANGAAGYSAKSAMNAGQDALDFGLEVKPGADVPNVEVVLSTQATQLSGTLQDATGRPTPDYTIIVFATDKAYWIPQSRRIQSVRPGTDGSFTVRGLPAGDYMISAVTDVDPGEWFDPTFLEQLRAASTPVHLAEGDKKTQDLRIAGGG